MFTADGKYSVKTGYKFWHDNYNECSQIQNSGGWKKLWQLQVPHKVRVFLWRLCRNNVLVRNLLRGRGVQTTIMCPMCINDVEHLLHIFLDCNYAKACWQYLGLEFNTTSIESCSEWLLQKLAKDDEEKLVLLATGLWGIWSARNLKVWESKTMNPELAMQWSSIQVTQWREVQCLKYSSPMVRHQNHQGIMVHWKPPEAGALKVNADASVFTGSLSYSVGMVLRDHTGGFCKARNLRKNGEVSVFEAETEGVLAAIRWVMELCISNVAVESDSMLTVQALRNGTQNFLEVGNILQESRILLESRPDIVVSFVKKQANKVAHLLARVPC